MACLSLAHWEFANALTSLGSRSHFVSQRALVHVKLCPDLGVDWGIGSEGAEGEHGFTHEIKCEVVVERSDQDIPVDCKVTQAWGPAVGNQLQACKWMFSALNKSKSIQLWFSVPDPLQDFYEVEVHVVVEQEVNVVFFQLAVKMLSQLLTSAVTKIVVNPGSQL